MKMCFQHVCGWMGGLVDGWVLEGKLCTKKKKTNENRINPQSNVKGAGERSDVLQTVG